MVFFAWARVAEKQSLPAEDDVQGSADKPLITVSDVL